MDRPSEPQATLSKQPTNKLVDGEGTDRDPADSMVFARTSAPPPPEAVRSTTRTRSHSTIHASLLPTKVAANAGSMQLLRTPVSPHAVLLELILNS